MLLHDRDKSKSLCKSEKAYPLSGNCFEERDQGSDCGGGKSEIWIKIRRRKSPQTEAGRQHEGI